MWFGHSDGWMGCLLLRWILAFFLGRVCIRVGIMFCWCSLLFFGIGNSIGGSLDEAARRCLRGCLFVLVVGWFVLLVFGFLLLVVFG